MYSMCYGTISGATRLNIVHTKSYVVLLRLHVDVEILKRRFAIGYKIDALRYIFDSECLFKLC